MHPCPAGDGRPSRGRGWPRVGALIRAMTSEEGNHMAALSALLILSDGPHAKRSFGVQRRGNHAETRSIFKSRPKPSEVPHAKREFHAPTGDPHPSPLRAPQRRREPVKGSPGQSCKRPYASVAEACDGRSPCPAGPAKQVGASSARFRRRGRLRGASAASSRQRILLRQQNKPRQNTFLPYCRHHRIPGSRRNGRTRL